MQTAKTLSDYNKELREALDNTFLRGAMEKFATAYPVGRANAFREYDVTALIDEVAKVKDAGISRLNDLYAEFKAKAEANGVKVHWAKDGDEANEIVARIAKENSCKMIVKSKSMTAEETLLNHRLEKDGLEVVETDLGEWIIQLRSEGPSHMVMPAIHLSRYQVAELFSQVTRQDQSSDIQRLVKVARRELRAKYAQADMGVSGANFAIAETGTIGLMTNEGNARLVTTLPRVHVAIAGIDKLCGTLEDALKILRVVPKNATGQAITSYVTWISGANECQTAPGGKKEMHIIFLDNGRSEMAKDPLFAQVLRCVRCGACANVCPVYRMVGGHQMGHIYIGAIGLILTYFFHGKDKARNLVQNCINCEACKHICAAGIDLPRLIKEIHSRILDEEGHPLPSLLLGKLMKNRKLFHTFLRTAKMAQRPLTGGTQYIRHLPHIFSKDHGFKALPAIAAKPFRDRFEAIKPRVSAPKYRIALFSGCVQDFVYPEQLEAAVKVLGAHGVEIDFPMDQSCCGLPLQMMGEKKASIDVAKQNIEAMAGNYDYIITLCASCASHLKHNYPFLLGENDAAAKAFADKVIPFSAFMTDVLGVTDEKFTQTHQRATMHAPCHLCRGMGVVEQPRKLLALGGYEYAQAEQEQVCCGFGGTYSAKFPGVSEQILKNKLADAARTAAEVLVTECPGCIMQLRGGAEVNKSGFAVRHIAEVLADHLK
ncbi:L-lactate dehydrogenase (quinone) large subunit LdhH [Desulfomicrobium escambiense]|uniref:L-lactate dehydrogenase (quinone) large subunit LdhH n=1 Tax=Desulfomicrobium escambiense TaxID=29503 RepID=UPI00040A1C70|nr:LUD domain-containing protein [Desulfomicrobium escambiense]